MSGKKTLNEAEVGKYDSAAVFTPPEDFRMPEAGRAIYLQAQADLRAAIASMGIEQGASCFVSGFSRELRRHLTVEAIQELLRGLADSMPEAAKYDVPEKK